MEKASFMGKDSVFATRLRELMKERKVTQEVLSKEIKTTRQLISYYCDGVNQPKIEKLRDIALFFNVSCDYLLGLSESKVADDSDKTIRKAFGISDDAIAALRLARSFYNGILAAEFNKLQREKPNSKEALYKLDELKAASKTLPCIEILLEQGCDKPRIIDILYDFFESIKATDKNMPYVELIKLQNALIALNEERKEKNKARPKINFRGYVK